ncbi:MAG: adenylate kinase, partial [Gammaproteobacteria bacterium]|nr:adenylate kinase [Gammaproteobacteria bacterium]
MKFINIIGTTGSGKSTLAKQLSKQLNLVYIELDD